jgi:hypothetical protein
MIELSGDWEDYKTVREFDEKNAGNVFIMDKVTYNKLRTIKNPKNGDYLMAISYDGPMILECKIVIVEHECFLKGII